METAGFMAPSAAVAQGSHSDGPRALFESMYHGSSSSSSYVGSGSAASTYEYPNNHLQPEFPNVDTVTMAAAILSLLGCLFVVSTYVLFPPLRRHHSTLVLSVALMGVAFYGTMIVQGCAAYGVRCQSAPVIQFSLLAYELYLFVLAFNFYYTTKYPFISTRWLGPVYHVAVWTLSAFTTYASSTEGVARVGSYGFCWYMFKAGSSTESLQFRAFFLPVCSGYCISIGWYLLATKRVRLGAGGLHIGSERTNLDTMRNFLFLSFGYWVIIGTPYLLRHEHFVTSNSGIEKALRFAGRFFLALKGTVNAILWARATNITEAYRLWRQGNWDDYLKVYEATWVLRRQILYFATTGIQRGTNISARSSPDEPIRDLPAPTQASWQGIYPWQLRFGVLQQTPSSNAFELQGVSDQKAIFRDFEPALFQEIRQLSGITPDSYVASFAGRTHERFSEGKSGSFLYYTGDQLFILKTCTYAEHRYILQILPQYMEHLRKNPNSYICRYVGCHELIIQHQSIYFIVLTNLLNNSKAQVDEFYDLKGSWVGRFRTRARKGAQRICKFCGHDFIVGMSKEVCDQNPHFRRGHAELVVGKDLNWSCRQLGLPADLVDQLGTQLYADTEFLERMNSMDYSLVIGLSRHSSGISPSGDLIRSMRLATSSMTTAASKARSSAGSQANTSSDPAYVQAGSPKVAAAKESFPTDARVVNMGIIDILTPWTLHKSVEHWVRVHLQCRDRHGISCTKPQEYADRFRRNVIDTVVYGNRSSLSDPAQATDSTDCIMVDFADTLPLV